MLNQDIRSRDETLKMVDVMDPNAPLIQDTDTIVIPNENNDLNDSLETVDPKVRKVYCTSIGVDPTRAITVNFVIEITPREALKTVSMPN